MGQPLGSLSGQERSNLCLRSRTLTTLSLSQRLADRLAGQQRVEHAPYPCSHIYSRSVSDVPRRLDRRSEAKAVVRLPGSLRSLREKILWVCKNVVLLNVMDRL